MEIIKKTRTGAYGIIIKDSKIALVKKAAGGYKGKLDLPGGGIEHDETIVEALKREIKEEIGIKVSSYKLFDVIDTRIKWKMNENAYEDLHQIGILYLVDTNDYSLKHEADGLDSEGADWYLVKDLDKNNLTPFTKYALEKLGY